MQKKSNLSDIEILSGLPVRLDFLLLADRFSNFKNPNKKIFDLKKKGYLHQIKRGQYFNLKSNFIKSTPHESVANGLYYPSYVSMEWALQFYGMILERAHTVTSVTPLRSKVFKTPLARFSYQHIPKNRYSIGYIIATNKAGDSFLIARPEKALIDYVSKSTKNLSLNNAGDIEEFLRNDLRLDLGEFFKATTVEDYQDLLPFYHRNSKEHRILKWLQKRRRGAP